jgi:hypothetical protein
VSILTRGLGVGPRLLVTRGLSPGAAVAPLAFSDFDGTGAGGSTAFDDHDGSALGGLTIFDDHDGTGVY